MIRHRLHRPGKTASKRRPIAPEDLCRFHYVTSPQISPDGSRVVFVEKQVGPRNDYTTNLWLVAAGVALEAHHSHKPSRNGHASNGVLSINGKRHDGAAPASRPRPLTQGGKDRAPQWSPDGHRVAFIRSGAAGGDNLYLIEADGGEARQLTKFAEGSIGAVLWSPDGRSLAVGFRACRSEWTEAEKKRREAAGLSDPPEIIDRLWYRLDGQGGAVTERRRLYLVDAALGSNREIYGEDVAGEFTFDFSPDSRQLVVSTNRAREPFLEPWRDELLRIDAATGRLTPIRGLPKGPKTAVRWSPDGKSIAYAGRVGAAPYYGAENLELFVCDASRGAARSLTAEFDVCLQAKGVTDMNAERSRPELQFSRDGRHVYCGLSVRGESHIAAVPLRGGRLKYLTRGAVDVRMGNLSADGRKMALTLGSATKLDEVAVLSCRSRAAEVTMLTDLNGPLLAELEIHAPETHWVTAADGHRVQLWSIVPQGAIGQSRSRRKLPAVLEIHGGPHAQYGAGFFNEMQVLASAGYAVFYSNPRGSKGYGRDHCAAIDGRWGTDDWIDIQAVIAFMRNHPAVDSRRMGVMGGSYGGYLTNWVISHCQDFAAAIADRSLSNLVSFSGSTDIVEPPEFFFPGNFWDEAAARWEQSPLRHAGNVRTPTLMLHSEGDLRCNIEQAEQFYSALRLMGVPARFIRFPRNTGHGMSREGPPDLRVRRLREIMVWLEMYLKRMKEAPAGHDEDWHKLSRARRRSWRAESL